MLTESPYSGPIFYVSCSNLNIYKGTLIHTHDYFNTYARPYAPRSINECHTFIYDWCALRTFVYNTTSRWLLRVSMQAFVNPPALSKMLNSLDEFNPLTDPVIKGHVFRKSLSNFGYFISRAAAEKLLEHEFEYPKDSNSNGMKHIVNAASNFNLTIQDMKSVHFLGHETDESDSESFKVSNFKVLPPCNDENNLTNINDILVAYDPGKHITIRHFAHVYLNPEDWVATYIKFGHAHFCRLRPA